MTDDDKKPDTISPPCRGCGRGVNPEGGTQEWFCTTCEPPTKKDDDEQDEAKA